MGLRFDSLFIVKVTRKYSKETKYSIALYHLRGFTSNHSKGYGKFNVTDFIKDGKRSEWFRKRIRCKGKSSALEMVSRRTEDSRRDAKELIGMMYGLEKPMCPITIRFDDIQVVAWI